MPAGEMVMRPHPHPKKIIRVDVMLAALRAVEATHKRTTDAKPTQTVAQEKR